MATMKQKKADAVAAQLAAMAAATTELDRYWAGSITAGVIHHYQAGAFVTVVATDRKSNRAKLAALLK